MYNAIQVNNPSRLLAVILNYRRSKPTVDCWRSLLNEVPSLPDTRVIVSDNASGNGSVEQIKAAFETEGRSLSTLIQTWELLVAAGKTPTARRSVLLFAAIHYSAIWIPAYVLVRYQNYWQSG
ncbi:hypothetical protein [Microseira wollei]|uniref:Glycosyl transferase family 2 n=1 Tax=Microseira wollei NIES-4236 TaxID=2530354 RepID=A0AAV3XC38_9CYAN|nr:hypothetical protein [Microseira wollei]GET39410.1 glycosyl transferase family 2 [Microseira wollei NIES-4236]